MRLEILSGAPSKTQALRCFQRIHAPRIITVFSPFFFSFGIFSVALRHQQRRKFHESWVLDYVVPTRIDSGTVPTHRWSGDVGCSPPNRKMDSGWDVEVISSRVFQPSNTYCNKHKLYVCCLINSVVFYHEKGVVFFAPHG